MTIGDGQELSFMIGEKEFKAKSEPVDSSKTLLFTATVPNDFFTSSKETKEIKLSSTALAGVKIDTSDTPLNLDNIPKFEKNYFLEARPEIVEITADPKFGEYFTKNDENSIIDFYVKFDAPVEFTPFEQKDLKLTLEPLAADQAVFIDQLDKSGTKDENLLHFQFSIKDNFSNLEEIFPDQIDENGGEIKSKNGTEALTQISETVRNEFTQSHEIKIFEGEQPKIIDLTFSEMIAVGGEINEPINGVASTLQKVSGKVGVEYNQKVTTSFNEGGHPSIEIGGMYTRDDNTGELVDATIRASDGNTLGEVQNYEFTDVYIDVTKVTDVELTPVTLTAEKFISSNETITNEIGATASKIIGDDIKDTINVKYENGEYVFSVGAGPFDESSVFFKSEDYPVDEFELVNYLQADEVEYSIIYAIDSNGREVNYLDEYSNNYKDLSLGFVGSGDAALRAVVPKYDMHDEVFITPLSELQVQIIEMSSDQSSESISSSKDAICEFFGLSEFVLSSPNFINDTDANGNLIVPDDEALAVTLAVLSTMDAVSGSIWSTLDILAPVIAGVATQEQLVSAQALIKSASDLVPYGSGIGYENYHDEIREKFDDLNSFFDVVSIYDYSDNIFDHDFDELDYILDGISLNDLASSEEEAVPDEVINNFENPLNTFDFFEVTKAEHQEWDFE